MHAWVFFNMDYQDVWNGLVLYNIFFFKYFIASFCICYITIHVHMTVTIKYSTQTL